MQPTQPSSPKSSLVPHQPEAAWAVWAFARFNGARVVRGNPQHQGRIAFLPVLTAPSRIFEHPVAQPFIQALGFTTFKRGLAETAKWFTQLNNLRGYKADIYNL